MNHEEPHTFEYLNIEQLTDCLLEQDAQSRADAACALGDRVRVEGATLPSLAVERLVQQLDDQDPFARLEAAMTLAEVHDFRGTPVLIEALEFKAVRLEAMRALGIMGDRAAIAALSPFLSRWLMPWADKLQAAAATAALGDAEGYAYLEARLKSRRFVERAAAIHFLGESKQVEVLPLLRGILADPSDAHRGAAAHALALLGTSEAHQALVAAEDSLDGPILEEVRVALETFK